MKLLHTYTLIHKTQKQGYFSEKSLSLTLTAVVVVVVVVVVLYYSMLRSNLCYRKALIDGSKNREADDDDVDKQSDNHLS